MVPASVYAVLSFWALNVPKAMTLKLHEHMEPKSVVNSSGGVQDLVKPNQEVHFPIFNLSSRGMRNLVRLRRKVNFTIGSKRSNHTMRHFMKHNVHNFLISGNRSHRGVRDLAMVHVPTNWGHTIEMLGLGKAVHQDDGDIAGTVSDSMRVLNSNILPREGEESQRSVIEELKEPGGEVWAEMEPQLRRISSVGCDMYYTPQQHWPENIAKSYFRGRNIFGVIRDPYDKLVNEFRMQVMPFASVYAGVTRQQVSEREDIMEREDSPYTGFGGIYDRCDVNEFLRLELPKVKQNPYRANCHFVPQVEYLKGTYAINLPVDARTLPESFNQLMGEHGYEFRMDDTMHNMLCPGLWAGSLETDVKEMIKEIYAKDFDFLCKTWGYCSRDEMFCMKDMTYMCPEEESAMEEPEEEFEE